MDPEHEQVDGQCPVCDLVETHTPGCSPMKGRLFWVRMERDHALAALAEAYQPRQQAVHSEYAAKRAAIWARYQQRVVELKAAA